MVVSAENSTQVESPLPTGIVATTGPVSHPIESDNNLCEVSETSTVGGTPSFGAFDAMSSSDSQLESTDVLVCTYLIIRHKK